VSLLLLLVVAVVDKIIPANAGDYYRAGVHLVSNLVVGFVALEFLRRRAARERAAYESRLSPAQPTTEEADVLVEAAH
jgi:hypothetical protein